eukprot:81397_1
MEMHSEVVKISGMVKGIKIHKNGKWNQIQSLKNIKIRNIQCGYYHTLYLTVNGIVYSGGRDMYNLGVLGIGKNTNGIKNPEIIQYFRNNKKIITDIKTGSFQNLAICIQSRVYGWGVNDRGELGLVMQIINMT